MGGHLKVDLVVPRLPWSSQLAGMEKRTMTRPPRARAVGLLLFAAALPVARANGPILADPMRGSGQIATTPCKPENIVRACIMSDRPAHLAAVVHSVLSSAAQSTCIQWEIFTNDPEKSEVSRVLDAEPMLTPPSRHTARVTTLIDAEAALEERGITPVWQRPAFKKGAAGSPRRTPWSLREPLTESDLKHSHPLNLLRFYMSELPPLEGDERVLLFDDDVCVRRDVGELLRQAGPELDAPLITASCQMQQYEPQNSVFRIRNAEYTYADTRFLGTVGGGNGYKVCPEQSRDEEEMEAEIDDADCTEKERAERMTRNSCAPASLEPKLMQLHSEISGRGSFRNETAWNFGMTLVHLGRWRALEMGRRMDRWFVANEHFAFFAPNSMNFGLGIAYLAFAGQVACWPSQTVLDGLGFLNWNDLHSNGLGKHTIEVCATPVFLFATLPCFHFMFASTFISF